MGQWDIHQYYFDFFCWPCPHITYSKLHLSFIIFGQWGCRVDGLGVGLGGVAGNQFGSWSSATLSFTLDHLASDHHQEDLPHNQDCPTCRKLRAAKDVGLGDYPTHSSDCELGIADMQSQSVHLSCWLVSMLWRHTVKQILSPFSPLPLPEAPLFSDAGTVTQMAGASLERGRGATWATSLTRWHTHTGGRGGCVGGDGGGGLGHAGGGSEDKRGEYVRGSVSRPCLWGSWSWGESWREPTTMLPLPPGWSSDSWFELLRQSFCQHHHWSSDITDIKD